MEVHNVPEASDTNTFAEKIKSNTRGEINKKISDELDEIKKRISKLEKS